MSEFVEFGRCRICKFDFRKFNAILVSRETAEIGICGDCSYDILPNYIPELQINKYLKKYMEKYHEKM